MPLLHWDISKNVCCNFSLSILSRHKFWNLPQLSYQTLFFHDQKFRTKTEISQEGKKLFRWNKNHFSSFLKDVQTWECTFKRQNQFSRLLPKHNIRGANMHSHLYSANAETDIQWFSWKNIHALKLHPNVKVHAFGLIDALGLFSIIRFNNTLQNLWNSYSITTKVRVNASSYFSTCRHA